FHSPFIFFFLYDTATPVIYTLSLHDALPISLTRQSSARIVRDCRRECLVRNLRLSRVWLGVSPLRVRTKTCPLFSSRRLGHPIRDRKSTRLNSSHVAISYAVFCLKKKNKSTE